ncbi:MAG: HPr family phosphocarrier protein [Planctomycetota bacterium]|jgi:phosphotransferase system HPr (HPr) family protein
MNAESPESVRDAAGGLQQEETALREETVSREVVVVNAAGLHARPADLLAREARKWQSRIALVNDSQRADGKSILELLTLAAEAGTRLVVEATGPDAREALDAIGSLFESRFNEHENDQES